MYCCSRKRNDSGKVEHTRQHPIGLWQTHFLAEYRVSSAGTFNRHQRKITSLLSVQIESLRSCFIFAILLNPLYSFNTICMILPKTNKFLGASQIRRISNGYECFIYTFTETLNMQWVKIPNKSPSSNLRLRPEQRHLMEVICREGADQRSRPPGSLLCLGSPKGTHSPCSARHRDTRGCSGLGHREGAGNSRTQTRGTDKPSPRPQVPCYSRAAPCG